MSGELAAVTADRPEIWPPDDELMAAFESLGRDCEFGLAQRAAGAEPPGLLRFAGALLPKLIAALDTDFAGVDDPAHIAVRMGDKDFRVELRQIGMRYHTFRGPPETTAEALHALEVGRVRLLRRKLLADLARGDRIFVYKHPNGAALNEAGELLAALRRHGPATLLWVGPEDGTQPAGTVAVVAPGLLRGHLGRHEPHDVPGSAFVADWLRVCRGAWRLVAAAAAPGKMMLAPAADGAQPNLVPDPESCAAELWSDDAGLTSAAVPPPFVPGHAVACHVVGASAAARGWTVGTRPVRAGFTPGAMHVASAYVWIPRHFGGDVVGMVLSGLPSVRLCNARCDRRESWQRAWVTARIPAGTQAIAPGLYVQGRPGDVVYSTGWRLERGVLPDGFERDA